MSSHLKGFAYLRSFGNLALAATVLLGGLELIFLHVAP